MVYEPSMSDPKAPDPEVTLLAYDMQTMGVPPLGDSLQAFFRTMQRLFAKDGRYLVVVGRPFTQREDGEILGFVGVQHEDTLGGKLCNVERAAQIAEHYFDARPPEDITKEQRGAAEGIAAAIRQLG